MRGVIVMAGLVAAGAAFMLSSPERVYKLTNIDTGLDLSGVGVPSQPSGGFGGSSASSHTGGLSKAQALALIASLDASHFGGWFSQGGRSHKDIAAIWKIESNWNKNNYNPNDPSGAWGIGQVLATTAAQFGFNNPQALLGANLGGLASMKYLQWSWKELSRLTGEAPSKTKWIMAYNAGAAGVARGRIVPLYIARYSAARLAI